MGTPTGEDKECHVSALRSAFLTTPQGQISDSQICKKNEKQQLTFLYILSPLPPIISDRMGRESQLSDYAHTGAINHIIVSIMNLLPAASRPRGRALGCEPTVFSGRNCEGPGFKSRSCNSFSQYLPGPDLRVLHTSPEGSVGDVSTSINVMIKST